MQLDHLAIAGETLADAVDHVESGLGITLGPGGEHVRFGTHNRLAGLAEGLYLEAISINPDAPAPHDARWFGLDEFTGPARLAVWICRVDDLEAELARLAALGVDAGSVVALERGGLRWRMAVRHDGRLPFDGVFPALLQWDVDTPPGDSLAPSGAALRRLSVTHPEADRLAAALGDVAGPVVVSAGQPCLSASFDTPGGDRTL